MAKRKIGEILIERGLITDNELDFALDMQKLSHEKLGEVLISNKICTPENIAQALATQLDVEYVDLNKKNISAEMTRIVKRNTAKQHHLVPLQKQGDVIYVAMEDPLNYYAMDEVRKATNLRVIPFIATKTAIEHAINTLYGNELANKAIADFKKEQGSEESSSSEASLTNFDYIISPNVTGSDT